MADLRSLVIKNGTTQQISNADTLIVGTQVDAASGQTLTIGGTNATSITVGSASITTNFPGPVTLTGDVTTVGGTTFTTDATFEGNVTFGDVNTDTVDFVAKVDSNIVFTGDGVTPPAYNIQNVKDPVNAQDVATKAYVDAASGAASLQSAYQNGNTITTSAADGAVIIAGDQNFTFTSSGNFGVGAGAPTALLSVAEKLLVDLNGRLTKYDNAAPTNGQLLIGDTAAGYWKAGTLSGGTTGLSYTNGAGSITLTGTLVAANGGTGQSSYTAGDLLYATGATTLSKLAIGSANTVLRSNGTAPAWGSVDLTTDVTGTLPVGNGGTGTSTAFTQGSVVFAGAAGVYDQDNANLFWDNANDRLGVGTSSPSATLTVSGGITQSGGAVSLTANGASSFTTSSGALTLTAAAASTWSTTAGALTITSAAAATWSTAAGTLALSGAANLELAAGAGSEVVVNQAGADVDFRVESDTNTHMLFVDAANERVGVGVSTLTHTFNVGSGVNSNFAVASGGRIHTYDGTNPTDGQVLIGDTAGGNFAKSTLTAGSGISITNGAGSITLAATGTVPLITTGLTAGDVCYASSNNTGSAAIATAAATSRVLGVVATVGASGSIQATGIFTGANFITGLTGLAAGQPVFLAKTAGKLTNDVSAFVSGDVVAEIGIAVNVTSGTGGAAAADILIQPKSIVQL